MSEELSMAPPRKHSASLGAYLRHYMALPKNLVRRVRRRRRRKFLKQPILRGHKANRIITAALTDGLPTMISRLGTTEATAIVHFRENQVDGFCTFPETIRDAMRTNSGFFPSNDVMLSRFCIESIEQLEEIDILGVRADSIERSFWDLETAAFATVKATPQFVDIENLLPMGQSYSWTRYLAGKRVLVVHPFEKSIRSQYARREMLFSDQEFLPSFELDVLRAEQTAGDSQQSSHFSSWFEALDSMKASLRARQFDVALIGAGAYGMFLASECKRLGKVAIHIGGATQLLFGIHGRRWTEERGGSSQDIRPLINAFWVTALSEETPKNERSVEGGGYWQ